MNQIIQDKNNLKSADYHMGLTNEEAESRKKNGLNNCAAIPPTKSVKMILKDHLLTLFNLVNIVMGTVLFINQSYKNMLFLGVVFCNIGIGLFQEIRAKISTDKLSLLAKSQSKVLRDAVEVEIPFDDIVLGDIVKLSIGDYVPAGCIIKNGSVEVNESFITGECESISKTTDEYLYCGSMIVSGSCYAEISQVGKENLIQEMQIHASKYKNVGSQIIKSLRKIINIVTVFIIPYSFLFYFLQNSRGVESVTAINNTVAALVGMMPEGLVLLVSGVMTLSVYRLSKKKVLVKELYSIETLARTDTICLDKTGTLTDGSLYVEKVIPLNNYSENEIINILGTIAENNTENETVKALKRYTAFSEKQEITSIIPFSSKTKYCMVSFSNHTYILGAPNIIVCNTDTKNQELYQKLSNEYRVLCIAESNETSQNAIPENRTTIAFVLLNETIRSNAKDTIHYFQEQNVNIKVISGDDPITVSAIAQQVGISCSEKAIDLTGVSNDADYTYYAENYTVFGRATPFQKKAIINALQRKGHTVAMTGDGVNDTLAMREADCSIAINDGSSAARNVADIVLLNSDYDSIPEIVYEGRTAIHNLEFSSSLFLVKTVYSILLGTLFLFIPFQYPFIPIQLTLVNSFTVAIPSLILSLRKNKSAVKGNFLFNAISKAIPIGVMIVISILTLAFHAEKGFITFGDSSSLSAYCVAILTSFGILTFLDKPNKNIVATVLSSLLIYLIATVILDELFNMIIKDYFTILLGLGTIFIALILFFLYKLLSNYLRQKTKC